MNDHAEFDDASFILGREIRNRTNKQTSKQTNKQTNEQTNEQTIDDIKYTLPNGMCG